ncbi:MAG: hypothetical protein EOP11_05670 [Proteobacteria bacterium]|nr:MAG: hypothetical protein EOP11_05670 [Pseudomonadota bacterium]
MKSLFKKTIVLGALVSLSSLSSLSCHAADPTAFDEAFPQTSGQADVLNPMLAGGEIIGAGMSALMAGENSMAILRNQREVQAYADRARGEVAARSADHAALLAKQARFEELENYWKNGAGLPAKELAEHATLKQELKASATQLASLNKLVEEQRLSILAREPFLMGNGDLVNPEKYLKKEARELALKRAAIVGGGILMLGDGGRRLLNTLSSSSPGYAPSVSSQAGAVKTPRATPDQGSQGTETSMSVQ